MAARATDFWPPASCISGSPSGGFAKAFHQGVSIEVRWITPSAHPPYELEARASQA
jgi:hypothetical protein